MFAAAMPVLVAEFFAYLDRADADPVADSVGYRQFVLWLGKAELSELGREVRKWLEARAANGPSPDRRAYLREPRSPFRWPTRRPPDRRGVPARLVPR